MPPRKRSLANGVLRQWLYYHRLFFFIVGLGLGLVVIVIEGREG